MGDKSLFDALRARWLRWVSVDDGTDRPLIVAPDELKALLDAAEALDELEAENARLKAALEPFASRGMGLPMAWWGYVEAARAALASGSGEDTA